MLAQKLPKRVAVCALELPLAALKRRLAVVRDSAFLQREFLHDDDGEEGRRWENEDAANGHADEDDDIIVHTEGDGNGDNVGDAGDDADVDGDGGGDDDGDDGELHDHTDALGDRDCCPHSNVATVHDSS